MHASDELVDVDKFEMRSSVTCWQPTKIVGLTKHILPFAV